MKNLKIILSAICWLITLGLAKAQPLNSKELSVADMQKELAIIKSILTSIHPGIYRYQIPRLVDSLFNIYHAKFSRPMTSDRYFIFVSQLLTQIHCGHTYLNPWNQPRSVAGQPFYQKLFTLSFQGDRW